MYDDAAAYGLACDEHSTRLDSLSPGVRGFFYSWWYWCLCFHGLTRPEPYYVRNARDSGVTL